jgi:hypothetical protein
MIGEDLPVEGLILAASMNANDFRKLALKIEGAIESSHMNHPDFRVNGRIFATISDDGKRGMVKLNTEQQEGYIEEYPEVFERLNGAWGKQSIMVRFDKIDKATAEGALRLAHANVINSARKKKRSV